MLKKYRIQKILKSYIALGSTEKEELIKQLAAYGPVSCSMVLESISKGHILLADGRQILAALFRQQSVEDYILLLSNPRSKIRELVKGIISEKGGKGSVPALLKYLDHHDTYLRNSVNDLLRGQLEVRMVPEIAAFISHERSDVSENAVELLGMIGGKEALKHLLPRLKSDNNALKRTVVKALVNSRDEGVVFPLTELLLTEKDTWILKIILDFFSGFLKRGADEKVVYAVKSHLTSADLLIRQRAVDVLGKIATVAIIPDILTLIKGAEVNIRRSVVDILNMIKDPRAGEVLIDCIQDKDWWVREIASEALLKISEGNDAIKDQLLTLLSSGDENIRRTVAEYFNQVVYRPAYKHLLMLLSDEDWWVREKALTALGRMGDPEAIPHILNHVSDTEIKGVIPEALAGIRSEKAVDALLSLMERDDKVIRLALLKVFLKFDHPLVMEKVRRAVLDGDHEISETALSVLEEKTGKRVSRYDIELEFCGKDAAYVKKASTAQTDDISEDVGFSGNLSLFPLGEVIQTIEVSAKSGCLFMPGGKIFFDRGQLVHCEVNRDVKPDLAGTEAVYELFTRKEGTFRFVSDKKSDLVTVNEPTMSVVLEAARRVDEKKR